MVSRRSSFQRLTWAPVIEGMADFQRRIRGFTIDLGDVFGPVDDHHGRPGPVFVLEGIITDHRDRVAMDHGPDFDCPEDRDLVHWFRNRGTVLAVEISVDVIRPE